MKTAALLSCSLVAFSLVASATELGAPFTDGVVLQRGMPVPVWGRAKAGEKVSVSFAGQTVSATAGADGKWMATLSPMPASSESRNLTANELVVRDVLVGEVWFCAGQSNMDCPIWGGNPRYRDGHGLMELRKTVHPLVRCVKVRPLKNERVWSPTPRERARVVWEKMTPQMLEAFDSRPYWETPVSAVGWYFAREIHRSTGIPVGLVDPSIGGVKVDTWTPRSGYAKYPDLREFAEWKNVPDAEWKKEMARGPIDSPVHQPSEIFYGQVQPFVPFAMRGLIWNQGCSSAQWDTEDIHCQKLHALYDGWTKEFRNPNMKLYISQIAPGSGRVPILLAQTRFAAEEPNAECSVITDAGNPHDVHPNDKRTVAARLVLFALKNDYGFRDIIARSPVFDKAVAEGDVVTVSFRDVRRPFYVYSMDKSLTTGFELAGADGVFKPAVVTNFLWMGHTGGARQDGGMVGRDIVIRADGVPAPVAVRYLMGKKLDGNVYSGDSGLPLGIFQGKVDDALSKECKSMAR